MQKFNSSFAATLFAVILLTGFNKSNHIIAQGSGIVTVQSKQNFDNTVDQLKQLVAKNGMMVLAEINHGKILSMTGLSLNGIAFFVGNPQIGKQLFTADRGVGIGVPIRINVYEGTDGKTYVNYVKPSSILASFENETVTKTAQMLDQKVEMLTGMLAK